MSVLASLVRAYDRLPDAPPYGYSAEKIGALISLHGDGSLAHLVDLRTGEGRKRQPWPMLVPRPVKRTVAIAPNFLWDKSAYALGLTAGEGKRTSQEHAAFRARHAEWLEGTDDPGLLAFLRFLDRWSPDQDLPAPRSDELRDLNIIFGLESERLAGVYLHDRPAAKALWLRIASEGEKSGAVCLVSGEQGPVARLHPAIKGVWGAQSSGASLVSFNLDAFTSYGHGQGDNAPVSEAATFAYTTALNRFLARDSGHRVQIGDASTVFWADTTDIKLAEEAEAFFFGLVEGTGGTPDEDAAAVKAIALKLEQIRRGASLAEVEPRLAEDVRFHVLGLAPNAARLSVRFSFEDSFGALTARYQRFLRDLRIEPGPRDGPPPLWRYLREVAVQGKSENVPPGLAGDWMRAILTGTRYPATLLATTLMRIRADQSVNALRAALLKALLVRNHGDKEEALVALDEDNPNPAYQLGRLFALMERAQELALGRVNASIADRYYASASSTPARVFPPLLRGLRHHISDARKRGRGGWLEPRVGQVMAMLPPDLPRTLRLEDQGRFAVGYYHEKAHRGARAQAAEPAVIEDLADAGDLDA